MHSAGCEAPARRLTTSARCARASAMFGATHRKLFIHELISLRGGRQGQPRAAIPARGNRRPRTVSQPPQSAAAIAWRWTQTGAAPGARLSFSLIHFTASAKKWVVYTRRTSVGTLAVRRTTPCRRPDQPRKRRGAINPPSICPRAGQRAENPALVSKLVPRPRRPADIPMAGACCSGRDPPREGNARRLADKVQQDPQSRHR